MKIIKSTAALMMFCSPLSAETLTCDKQLVSVTYKQSEHAELVCKSVKNAEKLFEQCGLPPMNRTVQIKLVQELIGGCVGLYHCGQNLIEVLEPAIMQSVSDADGAFGFLPIEEYFSSVVVHELVHAASDDFPCPFENCLIRDEYTAYALQVMSLTQPRQVQFAKRADLNRPVSRDELSIISLFVSPQLFSQKVWAHFNQRDDPCGFIGQLSAGQVLLDRERF